MFGQPFNNDVVKKCRRMDWFIPFAREYHFNWLLIHIRVKQHFNWKAHCLIRFRSLFKIVEEVSSSYTTIKREVSWAKSLVSELMLPTKSLIQTKKNNGPETEP